MRFFILLPLLALLTSFDAQAHVTVISCNDGDTCKFNDRGRTVSVRIFGIDAPEKGQKDYKLAKEYLLSLLKNQTAELKCEGRSYKRKVCTILVKGKDIGETMVAQGYAWDSPKYSKGKYTKHMQLAQGAKLGIWKNPNIQSPYCFRPRTKKRAECLRTPASNP